MERVQQQLLDKVASVRYLSEVYSFPAELHPRNIDITNSSSFWKIVEYFGTYSFYAHLFGHQHDRQLMRAIHYFLRHLPPEILEYLVREYEKVFFRMMTLIHNHFLFELGREFPGDENDQAEFVNFLIASGRLTVHQFFDSPHLFLEPLNYSYLPREHISVPVIALTDFLKHE